MNEIIEVIADVKIENRINMFNHFVVVALIGNLFRGFHPRLFIFYPFGITERGIPIS